MFRASYLGLHPNCEDCLREGMTVAAVELHHLAKHNHDPAKFWDSEFVGLCKYHHGQRTRRGE